jgi:hypothetical protein
LIKKCDFPGCGKAGVCRAPKSRDLKEYWNFCKAHAAEYNKNWNYYKGMSSAEVEREWEKEVFGATSEDKYGPEHVKALHDFINGGKIQTTNHDPRSTISPKTAAAFGLFGLPTSATWETVRKKYRQLALKHHPDTARTDSGITFSNISSAYSELQRFFKIKK